MKRILAKVTGAVTVLLAVFCIDKTIYELSPWSGTLSFFDLTPYAILIAAALAVIFGVITVLLYKRIHAQAPQTDAADVASRRKESVLRALPAVTGIVTVYSAWNLVHNNTLYKYVITFTTYLFLSLKGIFIVHCVFTALFFLLTIIFIIILLVSEKKKRDLS